MGIREPNPLGQPFLHDVRCQRVNDSFQFCTVTVHTMTMTMTPNGLNELPEMRFEFPFNLIGDHDKQNKGLCVLISIGNSVVSQKIVTSHEFVRVSFH